MNNPSLAETERWLKSRIRGASPGSESDWLNPQGGSPGESRIPVYKDGYEIRLAEGISEVYEAVHAVLGDKKFFELCQNYIRKYPSRHHNLTYAGRYLAEFLADTPYLTEFPFLVDLAQLEWRVAMAFHAYAETPMDVTVLARLKPQDLAGARIVFQPSLSLVRSEWPIVDIWKARREPSGTAKMDLAQKRVQHAVILRKGLAVYCTAVEKWQHDWLENLLSGKSLEESCAEVVDAVEDMSVVQNWFAGLAADGQIVRCEF